MTSTPLSHTPGPWFVSGLDEIHYTPEDSADDSLICETGGNEASAHLIAAAPDLLAALLFVLTDLNTELDYECRLIIQDAIAKATGEQR